MTLKRIDVVVLVTLISVCGMFYGRVISSNCYGYDEADYMFAASQGLYANYLDQNTISFARFLRIGLDKGSQPANETSLSEFIRASGDIAFYRHYHGPLSLYGLIVWRYFADHDEYSVRLISLVFLIATVAAIYMGCLFILQEKGRLAALLASVMLICSYSTIVTAKEISTHGVYVLITTITLVFMAKLLQTNDLRYGYYTIAAMAFAFTATEYAPIILVTLIVCLVLHRRELFPNWSRANYFKALGLATAVFVGAIFLLWPGAWLKLSLVKNYMFNAYLALGREGQFGTESFVQVWRQRVMNSPLEYTLVVAAALTAMVRLGRYRWLLPFLLYAFLMLAATFRITTSAERYISSFLPPLFVVTAILISHYSQRLATASRAVVAIVLISLLCLQGYSHVQSVRSDRSHSGPLDQLVNHFRTSNYGQGQILTSREFLPTLHFYFPEKRFQSYSDSDNIVAKLRGSSFDVVIYTSSNQASFQQELEKFFSVEPQRVTQMAAANPIVYYRILSRLATSN